MITKYYQISGNYLNSLLAAHGDLFYIYSIYILKPTIYTTKHKMHDMLSS